jgi:hypothetical protein
MAEVTGRDDISALAARTVTGELLTTVALHPVHAGTARMVPAGAIADLVIAPCDDHLLLIGRGDEQPALPNLGCAPLADRPIGAGDTITIACDSVLRQAYADAVSDWRLLTAAALVGLCTRALEIGIDYVMQRPAFGVLIATFQTIQHRLADHATAADGARLLTYQAAWARDEELATAAASARMAFAFTSEAAFRTAADSLHFHGGYGYTMEYDIQLYYRRAKAWPLPAGDPRRDYIAVAHELFDATTV